MVYKFFDKKSTSLADKSTKGSVVNIKFAPQNQQLAEKLHKPILRKFEKEKHIQHLKTRFGVPI